MSRKKPMRVAPVQGAPAVLATGEQHHPYCPSRWPALVQCPRWEGKPSSAAAERGTALHKLFARVLVGEEVEEPGDMFEANVIKLATKFRSMHLEDKGDLPEGERALLVEELVWLGIPGGLRSDIFGRVDCAFMERDRRLHVIDLKSAEHVDRDPLPQLIGYANGIVTSADFRPTTVCLHVAYADSGRDVEVQMPTDEVWRRYGEIYELIQDIATGKRTQPRQCGFCDICAHQIECPAVRADAEAVSGTLADALERWPEYTPARKARLCLLAETVVRWGEAIRSRAGDDAKAGLPVEDPSHGLYYGTQERMGRLVIPDVQAAWAILKAHLSAERYRACLSVNQAELKTALKLKGLKSAEVTELIERCGTRLPPTTVFLRKLG